MLTRLLADLAAQQTDGLFTYSVVVADNDEGRSAAPIAAMAAAAAPHVPVTYCVQPRRNIALTRNTAIAHATGDFIAFIDDDEWPTPRCLLTLFTVCRDYGVDGVLGPVKPHFAEQPPAWIATGKFYDRPSYPTGLVIDWRKGRTGNVLLARRVVEGEPQPFREEFLTGEDQDFFRRMIAKGHTFVWCDEALAYETVPPIRWSRTFMLRRALLRGGVSLAHPAERLKAVVTSCVAVPVYLVALPFTLPFGQARFMTFLVSLFDHLGRLLALVGIHPVRQPYVTE